MWNPNAVSYRLAGGRSSEIILAVDLPMIPAIRFCFVERLLLMAVVVAVVHSPTTADAEVRPVRLVRQAHHKEAQGKPNVLVVVSDDQSWPHCGVYGDRLARTPAFDRIARNGVLFTHAFCNASQCGPARSVLVTGRHIWQLEQAGTQASTFPKKFAVYPDILSRAGYHVGYTGKPWAPGNWRAGGRTINPVGRAYNERRLKPPTPLINRNDYAANFGDFLQARPKGAPFCFWFGCVEPHRDYAKDSAVKAGWDPAKVKVPPYLPDNDTVRRDLLDYYFEIAWYDKQLAKIVAHLERIGELDNTLIIITSDNGMPFPRAKATLYESGTRVPFAVQWPAKIKGGQVIGDLISFVDVAPTILEATGLSIPTAMTGRSLLPRLLGTTTRKRNHVLLGKERHNHARADNVGYPERAIRTQTHLFILNFKPDRWPMGDPPNFYCHTKMSNPTKDHILEHQHSDTKHVFEITYAKRPAEELYDLRADPHCLKNVAADPSQDRIKQQLKTRLLAQLRKQRDPRMLGFGDIFDSYPFHGRIQAELPGFKKIGESNPAFLPPSGLLAPAKP